MISAISEKPGLSKLFETMSINNEITGEKQQESALHGTTDEFASSDALNDERNLMAMETGKNDSGKQKDTASGWDQFVYGVKTFVNTVLGSSVPSPVSEAATVTNAQTGVGVVNGAAHVKKTDAAIDGDWDRYQRINEQQGSFNKTATEAGVDPQRPEMP